MTFTPFTGNLTSGEISQNAPDRKRFIDPYYAGGSQQTVNPYEDQLSSGLIAGLGVGAAGLGIHYGLKSQGRNIFDYAYSAARTAEEFSPAQILRTFAVGDFLSQYTTAASEYRFISSEEISKHLDTAWFKDIMHRAGAESSYKAVTHGLTLRDAGLYAGDDLLINNARAMSSSGRPHLATAMSRASGFKDLSKVSDVHQMDIPIEYRTASGASKSGVFYFTGGKTKTKAAFNQLHGLATEWVERANRLAASPFEMEPFESVTHASRNWIMKNLHFDPSLSVKSGAALPTVARMAGKWGLAGTAAYLGYKTADYTVRKAEIFDNTVFDEGITAAAGSLIVKSNLVAASIADAIPGVRSYQEAQESIAPGSTDLLKLAAIPLTGALSGLTGGYITSVYHRAKLTNQLMKTEGLDYASALLKADDEVQATAKAFSSSLIPKGLKGRHIPFVGTLGKTKQLGLIWGTGVGLLALPFLPGALIPENTEDELKDIYSGKKEIAVRKGRWWEFGRTPIEGGEVEYYRPHWFPRMLQRSKAKSLGTDDTNPISQWFKENFTYEMEKEHYKDRPYPITGGAFADIPILGPTLSATLGELVKPTKLMHTDEWRGPGDTVLRTQGRMVDEIDPARGDTPEGTPVNPRNLTQTIGEQIYRFTELSGLVGFTASAIKGAVTGSDEFFDQEERLQSARRMYGAEREYWDLSLGGGAGTTEFYRRLNPHRRRQIQEYNPIRNEMPDWIPGAGERAIDFQHGDPFTKIPEGELRLPGEGYAARFSELEGVDPENYSALHRFKILADVAPYSQKRKDAQLQTSILMRQGKLSQEEIELYEETKAQLKERKIKKSFFEYKHLQNEMSMSTPGMEQSKGVLDAINSNIAAGNESTGFVGKAGGMYWEALVAGLQNPLEALTPLAPASKLLHLQTAIEDYEKNQVYGREMAFWQSPVENFVMPFFRESADFFGMGSIPDTKKGQRQLQEYFDVLKYEKNKRIAEEAESRGMFSEAGDYERASRETSLGINPYLRHPQAMKGLFRALPQSERDYFEAFSNAKTREERDKILELVPENQRRIYKAQWELNYAEEVQKQIDEGKIPDSLLAEAEEDVRKVLEKKKTEGFAINDELSARYESEKKDDESYGDWFRRSVIIPDIHNKVGLPGPDWVGWHPAVSLDDIKLKVVKNAGMDIHDFGLWESDERRMVHKDYINNPDESVLLLDDEDFDNRSAEEVKEEINNILADLGIMGSVHVLASESDEQDYKIALDISETREGELKRLMEELDV